MRERPYTGWKAMIITTIAIAMVVYHILYILAFLDLMDVYITPVPHRALSMSFTLVLCFILLKGGKKNGGSDNLQWYDALFILLSLAVTLYVFIGYERWLVFRPGMLSTTDIIVGIITLILLLEAGRRLIGLTMNLVVLFFVVHSLFAHYFPGFLYGRGTSLSRMISHNFMTSEGVWGAPLGVAATVIISFVIFGQFLFVTGGGNFFIDLSLALVGRVRGGPAKVAVVASGLFGSISGSTAANVATTGVVTIPIMKKVGYSSDFAGGVEATASNGGQILPPVMGAVAFLISEFLGIPYSKVCIAAVMPAVLYYLGLFFTVDLHAAKNGLKGLPADELPLFWKVLREGWTHIIPLIVLIAFMFVLYYTPERSCLYALFSLIVVNVFFSKNRLNIRGVIRALEASARNMLLVNVACGLAGIIIGCLSLTGLGIRLTSVFVSLAGNNLFILLLLISFASFILGMGSTAVTCYIMVVLLAAPALVKMGVPELSAHMFVFYWGTASFITPPVALAAYSAAAISGGDPIKTGIWASRIGLLLYIIPFLMIYRPAVLLMGPPIEIVATLAIVVIGVWSSIVGVTGYLTNKLYFWERLCFLAGSFGAFYPSISTNIGGGCLIALVSARHVRPLIKNRSRKGLPLKAELL